MKPPSLEHCELGESYFAEGNHIKAMELTEDAILTPGNDQVLGLYNFQQGAIFKGQAKRTDNSDVKFAFLLGSVESFSEDEGFSSFCALSFFELGQQIGSSLYYKKSVEKAKEYLSILATFSELSLKDEKSQTDIKRILKDAESRIAGAKTIKKCEPKAMEPKNVPEPKKNVVKGLRSYWMGLSDEFKRNFMKVSTAKLTSFVEGMYGTEGRDALEQVLTSVWESRKWRFWMCRSCSKKFCSPEECKDHLEQKHGAAFRPESTKHTPQKISKVWARKIFVGGWEPVDAAAAVEMIKNQLEDVKAFVYKNGWSEDWPLAADEERSKLLKEIKLLLVSFCDHKVLSCSIRDWMMQYPVKHLAKFEISEHTLTTECRLVETPQSICFLECCELNQILEFLKNIKCERDDGTELVCRAVDSFRDGTRVKEKIDFDPQLSFLLLDKRLLKSKMARFDDEGTVNVVDPDVHYANAQAHGDDILYWLADYSSEDENFRFPRPIRTHNIDIWVAVLRAVQFTCRTLRIKYEKKVELLCYDAALTDAKNLCIREDERRRITSEDQWNIYASLLCDKCEEHLGKDAGNSLSTKIFLCAVRDVLEGASYPKFDYSDLVACLNVIQGHKHISDDIVLKSIDILKSVVTNKVPVVDVKILLVENSRINLLSDLVRLSVFDYRSYILQPLRRFLQEELDEIVDAKAKLAAAEQEKEKKSGPKKKKDRNKQRTSTSVSSHLDQNVEHEPGVTSPSLNMAEEDSVKPEDTNDQEEATKDTQSMPGEESLSKQLESVHIKTATRYNSALDMMLKSLCNSKVLKEDLVNNQQPLFDNQVPCALRVFFSAFVSEKINEEEVYNDLLSNLLASLEEIHSLSSDAYEVFVDILEFWHCWKSPETESLVTRLFTLEEYERMSCRKCTREPNDPERSSYGIAMAADSIRDLKFALGNIKFVDILQMIHMEDQMLCDIKTGGCGTANFIHHIISRCPPIFTIVLQWENTESEKEISETTNALEWEIDISRLYKGLEPNTKYRLVSMVGCIEEGKYICMAYKKNQWVSLKHEALAEEVVGDWESVVKFCGDRKVRPEILFYEAV